MKRDFSAELATVKQDVAVTKQRVEDIALFMGVPRSGSASYVRRGE